MNTLDKISNRLSEVSDKLHTQSGRTGITCNRIEVLFAAGLSDGLIAHAMTEFSRNGFEYTAADVASYRKLYADNKTSSPLPMHAVDALTKVADSYAENGEIMPA